MEFSAVAVTPTSERNHSSVETLREMSKWYTNKMAVDETCVPY